jgi:sugar lactone lactonase YvrE
VSEVERVLPVQNRLGEGPRWSMEEQALYWVDIENDAFHRFDPATGEHDRCVVGLPVGALGFRAAGGLIMATRDGFAVWEPQTQDLRFLTDPEAHRPESRFNDGAVDCMGRFWAGTMSADPTSNLYRLDPDGTVHQMETGLTSPTASAGVPTTAPCISPTRRARSSMPMTSTPPPAPSPTGGPSSARRMSRAAPTA